MKIRKKLIILSVLSFLFPLAVQAEAVTEIDLNSGAARSDTFISVNEQFETVGESWIFLVLESQR